MWVKVIGVMLGVHVWKEKEPKGYTVKWWQDSSYSVRNGIYKPFGLRVEFKYEVSDVGTRPLCQEHF